MRAVQAARGTTIDETTGAVGGAAPAVERERSVRPKVVLLGVAVVCWGLDQATKALAVRYLDPEQPYRMLGGLLTLQLVRNPGAAFSFGVNHTIVFTILSAVVLLLIMIILLPRVRHVGWGVALGFVSAGILGNLSDRLFRPPTPLHGHVVDFLQLPHWAIFNVADMCVCVAAVLIVILSVIKNVPLSGVTPKPPADRS